MLDPKEQILAHCEMLHKSAAGVDGVLVVSVFYANPLGDTDRPGTISHHTIGDAERMADAISAHLETPNANVYVGLQVMRKNLKRGSRGTESDVVAILGLVADMDADTGKVGALPMAPSYSVETSPGNEQPVWLFSPPLSVADAKPLAAALQRATGSDNGTKDVCHVWRVPGTLNWPNKAKIERGRQPEPVDVSIKTEWSGDYVEIADFRAALAPYASATADVVAVEAGEIPNNVDTSPELQEMLASDGAPDRSAHAARVVEKLAFHGHSLEEAVSLVVNCQGAWAERYRDSAHRQKDVERLWAKFAKPDDMVAAGKEIADAIMAGFEAGVVLVPSAPPPAAFAALIKATPFEWKDPTKLPRREFMNGTHLIRKYLSLTAASGGLGKSSLIIAENLAMSSGRPLFGGGLEPPRNCWIVNLEDPMDELDRRIMAACIYYRIQPEQIADRLFVNSGRDAPIVIAVEQRDGVKVVKPVREAVIAAIKKNNIDVLSVDPFVSSHRVNENNNGSIDEVAKEWSGIADECNIAIDMIHHVRKVSDREATVEDARGASALLAASRAARVLNRMTTEQAQSAGIPESDRMQYFSIQNGKANLAPLSSHMQWRKLESVALGNHMSELEPQDHAAVVAEWHWPSKEEAIGDLTSDEIRLIKARIQPRDCKRNNQAKEWVGFAVAEALNIGDAKAEKTKIDRMVMALISMGELSVERVHNKRVGRDVEYIRVPVDD